MEPCYIFGSGGTGANVLHTLRQEGLYQVMGFFDNDPEKWGRVLDGVPVYQPDEIGGHTYAKVFVGSHMYTDEIVQQLLALGVTGNKIDASYVHIPYISRVRWLRNFAALCGDMPGNVAEAGVLQGEFAREINDYFPTKKLYLFDTFEGFDQRDVALENQPAFIREHQYNETSEEMVLAKMPHPGQCIICKGWFPQSAEGIDDRFCFVNLDMDLYQPTLAALHFFAPKMVEGGVIVIHDYYSALYGASIKKAIDEFVQSRVTEIRLLPVGDGYSIAVLPIQAK